MTASHAFQGPLPLAHKQHKLPKLPRYRSLVRLRNPPTSHAGSPIPRPTPREDVATKTDIAEDATSNQGKHASKVLAQYNSIMQDETSLIVRNLPPVKLSINSKSKFMEPVWGGKNSILRPTYYMPTYRTGHHVFTEGISDISKGQTPTFAMKAMPVPYSNLPASVTIRKKDDTFTFGVKNEKSSSKPNKHSNRPYGLEDANIIHPIEVGQRLPNNRNERKDNGKIPRTCARLEPIVRTERNSNKIERRSNIFVMNSSELTVREDTLPFDHCNISLKNNSATKHSDCQLQNIDRGESRLGVVSIGDSVTPTYYNRNKRTTRNMYPMYDYKAIKKEAYNKLKFGLGNSSSSQSTLANTPSFSRVSNSMFDFRKENTNQSIASNRNMARRLKSSRRTRALHLHNFGLDSEFNVTNSRRVCPRRAQPPRSSDSNGSTVLSQFPHNPPPSEISLLVAEEMGQLNDIRTEMLPLQEERTMTASVKLGTDLHIADPESRNKDVQESGSKSSLDTPRINIGNQLTSHANQNTDIIHKEIKEEIVRDTDAEESVDKEPETLESEEAEVIIRLNINPVNDVIIEDNEDTVDENSYFQERADMLCKREIEIVNKYNSQLNTRSVKQKEINSQELRTPLTLAVPTVSLDILSHHTMRPHISHANNSVSRKMENSQHTNTGITASKSEQNTEVADNPIMYVKVTVPITNLKLNSDSASRSIVTPVFSITDELGDTNEGDQLCTDNGEPHANRLEDDCGNKRLLNNTKISFISPAVVKQNAKRQ